jgi:N-acetylglucosamine-6-sulfatase
MADDTTSRDGGLTRRQVLGLMGLGALALAGCQTRPVARRPNVVLILGDDHRHDALGCAGHPWIRTPQLDRLARDGVRFTNAFVTTSLCSPSRASILCGLYAHNHGVLRNEDTDLPPQIPTLGTLLQAAGYRTGFVGKWHQARSSRPRPGWDRWVSFKGQGDYERNTFNVDGQWVLSREYVTDALTGHALRFLDEAGDQPFCLVLAHKATHAPFVAAPRHRGLYTDAPAGGNAAGFDLRDYARTLAGIDESTGQILDRLAALRRLDDTLVIYASDNGFMIDDRGDGWFDKRLPYEPAIRIPLLMRYPRRFATGTVANAMALNLDLLPTVLAVCGVPPPASLDGRDLAPLVAGTARRDSFLYEYFPADAKIPPVVALRTTEWKYIFYPRNPELPDELYHLPSDPQETANRVNDPACVQIRNGLRQDLARMWRQTGGERSAAAS